MILISSLTTWLKKKPLTFREKEKKLMSWLTLTIYWIGSTTYVMEMVKKKDEEEQKKNRCLMFHCGWVLWERKVGFDDFEVLST